MVDNDLAKPSSWMAKSKENGAARYIIPPYDLYAGLLSGRICSPGKFMKNTIITFNYDTVLEEALGNWRAPFWYGFKPRSVEYVLHRPRNHHTERLDLIDAGVGAVQPAVSRIEADFTSDMLAKVPNENGTLELSDIRHVGIVQSGE